MCHAPRGTTTTGQRAMPRSVFETLPRKAALNAPRPREPTTITSDEQALVIFDDPSPVTNLWAEVPIERFLPRVVDARDGTIRPLSVPDEALADLSVAQSGTGRIWTGTSPDGRDLGVAYSDDGGARVTAH